MSQPSQEILELARAIRPYLGGLVDEDDATRADADLAALLAERGTTFDSDVLVVLERYPAAHDWAARFLEQGMPPELVDLVERSGGEYRPPPGQGVIAAARYVCPEGDFVRWQRVAGMELDPCPTHLLPLVPG